MVGVIASLVFGLLPFAVIGMIVAAVVVARRNGEPEEADPGIGTIRRIFLYGLSLVALAFAAIGLAMLIGGALDAAFGDRVIAENDRRLAIALSFTVVGAPTWLLFTWLAQRAIRDHAVERRAPTRRLALALVRAVSLTIVVVSAATVGRALLRVDAFDGTAWGWLLVWAGVWAVHERIAAGEPAATAVTRLFDRFAVYYAALLGLATLVAGAVSVIVGPLTGIYDRAFDADLVAEPWTETLRFGLVLAAVGGAAWGWHWLRLLARVDALTTLWRVYVFLFGILVGIAMTLVPASVLIHLGLQWLVGDPPAATAAGHFSAVPTAVASLVVGAALWGYHGSVLHEATGGVAQWNEPERIARYLASAAGLLVVTIAIARTFALVIDAIPPIEDALLRDPGWWRNPFVRSVSLLVVGLPLWAWSWRISQGTVAHAGTIELGSVSRRVYVFAATGGALLALLIALTIILFQLFEAILEGTLSREVARDGRWSVAVVLTAVAVAAYHLLVLREDQAALRAAEPERAAAARRRAVIVVAGGDVERVV
ncbi:MAG: hypothetical protein FJZ92_13035, partial [Chloroflexi bacterium]|nr:hypothetical protein [Chloroflexota bacterium]